MRESTRERIAVAEPPGNAHVAGGAESDLEAAALESSAHALRALAVSEVEIVRHLEALGAIRQWLGRPLWEMTSDEADVYFGEFLRFREFGLRVAYARALARYFVWLGGEQGGTLLSGRVAAPARCPIDTLNWPVPLGQARIGPQRR